MAYDEHLASRVCTLLGKRGVAYEEKRMMGGLTFMVNDKMCLGVGKARLMARIDPEGYDEALTRKGCRPMDFTGRPMRGFVFIEPDAVGSDRELARWLDLALAYNPKAPQAKKRKRA